MTYVLAVASLGFLIVVHEYGHLVVARLCGMRVDRFSIGFGPAILKKRSKRGTVYQLAPIPFGGFVEIRGMNIAEEIDPADPEAYPNRPAWQRFATIFAGPGTNYLSAIILAFVLFTCHGVDGTTFHVYDTSPGYDAQGKLLPGDRILAVDGVPLYAPNSVKLSQAINASPAPSTRLRVLRGNSHIIDVEIQKKPAKDREGKPVFKLGIASEVDIEQVGVIEAVGRALQYPIDQTKLIVGGLRDIITGAEEADPAGPVQIVSEFEKAFSVDPIYGIKLLMLLSVYLGLFNLFPLPALDGGRLVFLGYEMVTRRRPNPKIEAMVHMGGILVFGVIFILVTLNDCHVI